MWKRCLLAGVLIALASPAIAREKPPTYSFDPYRKTGSIVGDSHTHNALLDLNKWTWWFELSIVAGEPHNPVLMIDADTPDWHFFDHAADADGNQLRVLPGSQDLNGLGAGVHEMFAVELTPDYVRQHRTTGMNIKMWGSGGEIVIQVPAEAVSTFADGAVHIFNGLAAPAH